MITVIEFIFIIYLLVLARGLYLALIDKASPHRTIAWIIAMIFIPVGGLFLYYILGQNPGKEKLFSEKRKRDVRQFKIFKQQHQQDNHSNPIVRQQGKLINFLSEKGNGLLTDANQVRILSDGKETFQSIFEALAKAQRFIHMEYYIFEEGKLAEELIRLLGKKVRQGVKVRIIYDGVGSWELSDKYLEKIKSLGIHIQPFMPVRFGYIANKINYRNHRKIIVVDNKIGFIGGINVSDNYLFGDPILGNWRDTHLRLEGSAVSSLNHIFNSDWQFVSEEKINSETNVDWSSRDANLAVQIITSGPDCDYPNIKQAYFSLISSAQNYVYITTPYFIPGKPILFALKTAAMSGVKVKLLLPKESDSKILKWSIRSYLEELLDSDVQIYFYEKGFVHSKIIIVDDSVSSIGTANVDERSFDNNFEVNAMIYDKDVALELKEQFYKDLEHSQQLEINTFKKRPLAEKLHEATARLFSPLL